LSEEMWPSAWSPCDPCPGYGREHTGVVGWGSSGDVTSQGSPAGRRRREFLGGVGPSLAVLRQNQGLEIVVCCVVFSGVDNNWQDIDRPSGSYLFFVKGL